MSEGLRDIHLIGIDTGGTFTDLVGWDGQALHVLKVPSTPTAPDQAVIQGIAELTGAPPDGLSVRYGSTVATNAVLERQGARCALLTTQGFEDVLAIGRQERADIYALHPQSAPPLIPAKLRFGVRERLGPSGEVETTLEPNEALRAAKAVIAAGVDSVAICFLHAYANPCHEEEMQRTLREQGFRGPIACSSRVLPEHREYERTVTTCVQAYVAPVIDAHLRRLESAMGEGTKLLVMQSNGGVLSSEEARSQAVRTVLSGPAGGVLGASKIAAAAGYPKTLSFDMGGTSTDVSLCDGALQLTTEGEIGELPIRIPMLAIHTVGAGGGSIARRDEGGALVVGPESAGAVPGPACYGRDGTSATVTDAHLVLGRLVSSHFLGGHMVLDEAAALTAIQGLGEQLDLTPHQTAEGILRVAEATMARAVKVISVARGHDVRDFTLVSFGGAGGLHAASLARELGVSDVLVPQQPGLLSAAGILQADVVLDGVHSLFLQVPPGVALDLEQVPSVQSSCDSLTADMRQRLVGMGVQLASCSFVWEVDMRYEGQTHTLQVPLRDAVNSFHEAHAARFGLRHSHRPLELVAVRIQALSPAHGPTPLRSRVGSGRADVALVNPDHRAWWNGEELSTPLYDRRPLRPGHRIQGPALITEYSSMIAVPPGWRMRVDELKNLVLRVSPEAGSG